eukprot:scaffold115628_cov45-Phaeocystis_antarctica.AAC.1
MEGLGRSLAVRGGETSDFRGGWLEHPRRWLGAQWPGTLRGHLAQAARQRGERLGARRDDARL